MWNLWTKSHRIRYRVVPQGDQQTVIDSRIGCSLGTFRAVYLVCICCMGSFLFAYDTGEYYMFIFQKGSLRLMVPRHRRWHSYS
jgi:hypothetical protein